MMKYIRHSNKLVIVLLALMISVSACKSSKKAQEAARAAEEKARIEREAAIKKDEDARRKQEEEEKAAREAQAKQQAVEKESTPYVKLNQYFESISTSSNPTAANNSIQEALGMFASDETPVLIVISGTGDQKDYDRPTTIRKYLNYLKDQKLNSNKISDLQFDSSGKITEVELSKK